MLETRHFGMDADKSAGSGFGRTECGAKPEPQGCGEPIQRPWMANHNQPVSLNQTSCDLIVTVHGLDTGIPAGMTVYLMAVTVTLGTISKTPCPSMARRGFMR